MPKTKQKIDPAREELLHYFYSITTQPVNYASTAKILNRMMDSGNYTYSGLKYVLWYCKEQKEIDITSIAIAEYYYQEAIEYYEYISNLKAGIEKYNPKNETKIVTKKDKMEVIYD